MGLIVGPLTAAFVVFLRAGPTVRGELDRSADANRIGWAWTRDVQNVEPGGVNTGSGCNPAMTGVPEVTLISFQWNTSADAVARGEQPVTASWVAVGSGDDLQLVRRECSGENPVSTTVLARHVGIDGVSITSTIHGPVTGSPSDFCPVQDLGGGSYLADSCTIVIEGTFKYDLTVTRRVGDRSGAINILPPPPPTITGGEGRNTYLTVAWTPPPLASGQPPISGYRVFAYTDPNGAPVASAEVDGLSTSADVQGVNNGTLYWVRVQSQSSAQWGELSAPFGAISPNPTTPDAGSVVDVEPLNGKVSVTWSAPLNNGGSAISSWHLYAQPWAGPEIGPVVVTPGNATTGIIPGLTNGMSYTITVAAVNSLGEGVRSDPSNAVVPFGPADPPSSVEAKAGDATATVRWVPPTNDNGRPIIGYTVFTYKGLGQTTETASVYKTLADASCASDCEVSVSVANADYYRFAVQARTDVGDGVTLEGTRSGLSTVFDPQYGKPDPVPNYVRPSTNPGVPAAPTATISNGSTAGTYKLTVAVVLPVDNGANAHSIQVKYDRAPTGSPTSWTTVATVSQATSGDAGEAKSVVIDNLPSGYHYRTSARVANRGEWTNSGDRWGGWSTTSGTAVAPGPPSAPTAVVVSRPSGSFGMALNLTFGAPADNGGSGITGYSATCSASGQPSVSASSSTAGTITLTGLRDGRAYSCSVTATNAIGTGPAGNSAAPATPYGECTLKASQTQHIKQGHGAQSTTANFWVRQNDRYWSWFSWHDDDIYEAGLIRWNWSSNCSGQSLPLPAGSYIASATLSAYEESGQPFTHYVNRLNGTWSSSTAWAGPAVGTELGSWNANATGWRSTSSSALLAAVQEMRAGTNDNGVTIRNPYICDDCSQSSAKYTGSSGTNAPQVVMTFYTQGP